MPQFAFEALDSQGKEVKGEVEALTLEEAQGKIRQMGYFPTSVKERVTKQAAGPGSRKEKSFSMGGVSGKQRAIFTRQLATLIDAGLPVVRSLRVLEDLSKKGTTLKNNVIDIIDDVESGTTLSEAMAKHPKTFDRLYVSMVRAGEAAGALETILERLAGFMEKAQKIKKQVLAAMIYPVLVIVIAVLILIAIMLFVIPQFMKMFDDMSMTLPVPTRVLIGISNTLGTYWYLIPLVPFVIFVLFKLIASTKQGRHLVDLVKLNLPLFGMLIRKSTISRFCRTLGTLMQSGVPILQALTIVKEATGNVVVANAISNVHDSVREGDDVAGPLGQSKICDSMVVNMVAVGEETGELADMLLKVADNYDEDVDAMVGGLMKILEPVIIVFLGGAVGFIVISLILPLIKIMTELGNPRG